MKKILLSLAFLATVTMAGASILNGSEHCKKEKKCCKNHHEKCEKKCERKCKKEDGKEEPKKP